MEEKFVILCCENIRPEVDAILATGAMPLATARSFPFHCGHVRSVWETLKESYDELEKAGAKICLCGCGCANTIDIPKDVLAHPSLIFVDSGESLFLPETLVGYYQRCGVYLKLPGKLLKWKENAECNQLSQTTARAMFRESATEIILLDTGVRSGIGPVLAEFAEFTGLPARVLPVGIDHFRFRLAFLYRTWECEQQMNGCKTLVAASEKRVADYSMVADLTGKIIGIHDEKTVILQMLDIIFLICSPKRAGFLPVHKGSAGDIISIPPGTYESTDHFQRMKDPLQEYLITETGTGFLFRVRYNDDLIGVLSVDEVALPAYLDEYLNISHFVVDIAGLSITIARTHQELEESEERYRTIIENIQDVFFRIDEESRIVMVSSSGARTFGYLSTNEMLGKPILLLWKTPERRAEFLDAMRNGDGTVRDWEAEFVKKDGTVFWVSLSAHLNTDPQGGYAGTEGIIRDISERKKIEEALKEAIKKLNMLSSITRHDILNQIMGLRTYLDLSRDDLKGTRFAEFIEKEDQAAEAIQRQIEFTKYYQDIGVNAPKWQDAGAVIRSALAQLNPPGIEVRITVAGVEIFADPLIEKVFYNLLENSLRHGERVTMMAFSSCESEAGLALTYSDDGVGITAEDKQKLFRKGFGRHTGLGLFLSREILAITGITITENGEPGKGVRFEMTIPKAGYRAATIP